MLVLVLSDIHGNLQALQAVLKEAKNFKWKELWFLGDLCGYGPQPEECYQTLVRQNSLFLPGNHDLYLTGQLPGSFFSDEALRSLIMNRGLLRNEHLNIIKALPLRQCRKGVSLVHGSPENPSTDYILGKEDALRNFKAFKGACCLYGHSHVQEFYSIGPEGILRGKPVYGDKISYKHCRLLANPGSVGQPRDRDPRAGWCILDTWKKELTFFRTAYDIAATQEKMKALEASEFLINRLEQGI